MATLLNTSAPLSDLVEVAKALGHPARLRVLAMLRHGPLCVCQMTSVLDLAGSTVSVHLSELRRAGLVAEQKRGKWVHYRLITAGPLGRLLRQVLRLGDDDPQIRNDARVIEELRAIPVDVLCRAGLDLRAVGVRRARAEAARGRGQAHVD